MPLNFLYNFYLVKKILNFVYFTTIDKQVITTYINLISLIGTDVSMKESLMWEEATVPRKNPRVHVGDHHTLSGFHIEPLSIMRIELRL